MLEIDWTDADAPASEAVRRLRASILGEMAEEACEEGEFERALELLDRALGDAPDAPDLEHERGLVLLRHGEIEEARAAFTRALERAPGWAAAAIELALLEARTGRLGESLAALSPLAGTPPAEPRLFREGMDLLRAGSWEAAEERLRRAYRTGEHSIEASFRRFGRLLEEGHPSRALEEALRMFERFPGYADVQHALGLAYVALDWWDDAIEAFLRALERNPSYHEARVYLAWVLFTRGESQPAEGELARVLAASPGNEPALRLWRQRGATRAPVLRRGQPSSDPPAAEVAA